jgi:hypothetical protein
MSLARGSLSENRRVSANGENGIDSLPPSQLNRKTHRHLPFRTQIRRGTLPSWRRCSALFTVTLEDSSNQKTEDETTMRMFDVQGIEINAPRGRVFDFLREPANLPKWAHAFVSAENGRARLQTPAGAIDVGLDVTADGHTGVVDWRLEFPDGNVGVAQSRVTDTTRGTCIYSFVLHAPPVALEQVEGALDVQRVALTSELATLKALMEE